MQVLTVINSHLLHRFLLLLLIRHRLLQIRLHRFPPLRRRLWRLPPLLHFPILFFLTFLSELYERNIQYTLLIKLDEWSNPKYNWEGFLCPLEFQVLIYLCHFLHLFAVFSFACFHNPISASPGPSVFVSVHLCLFGSTIVLSQPVKENSNKSNE